MNLVNVKKASDIVLDGISVDAEFRDGSLHAVTLTDQKGSLVRIALDSYALRALIPAPPEKKKVNVLTGKVAVLGTPIREEFDHQFQAESRRTELESAGIAEGIEIAAEEVLVPF